MAEELSSHVFSRGDDDSDSEDEFGPGVSNDWYAQMMEEEERDLAVRRERYERLRVEEEEARLAAIAAVCDTANDAEEAVAGCSNTVPIVNIVIEDKTEEIALQHQKMKEELAKGIPMQPLSTSDEEESDEESHPLDLDGSVNRVFALSQVENPLLETHPDYPTPEEFQEHFMNTLYDSDSSPN